MKEKIFEIIESSISYGDNGIDISQTRCASEITAHVMEFITWIRDNQHQLFLEPTEDIYQYWLTNIYNH